MVRVLRWKCEKCQRKWIYPVGKCLYCNEDLIKEVGSKTKVVGNTKVYIPNPLHPIIPYNVLILEDEHANRMPKKTMKDYSIGDIYEDIPDNSDNAFASVRVKYDIDEAISEVFSHIGDLDIKKEMRIMIKPNLNFASHPFYGMSTNPKVISAVVRYLIDKGASPNNITIADQSFFISVEQMVSKSELSKIVEEFKINLMDLSKGEFVKKSEREFTFEISKAVFEQDLILNVPVIKTDMFLGLDGAFENLIRFLSKSNFDEFSKDPKKAAMALALLPNILPKFITLSDATYGMQGNGPAQHGEPGFYNLVFAARNPVVHDTAVCEIFCLRKLPYVDLAGKLSFGESDIKKISFVGNELEALRRDIHQPIGSKLIKKKE